MSKIGLIAKQQGFLIAILGTGAVLALILIASNFDFKFNINSKGSKVSSSQTNQSNTALQGGDSMHGGGVPVDTTIFNSLVGKSAPDFTLESYDGKKVTLSELKGKNVILFFNEGLMCYPSCWNQVAAFGKDTDLGSKAVILNITVDPKNDWKQAIDEMPELASATVVFDTQKQVSSLYGVLSLSSSMHKGQFPGHTYIIVDKEGIVRFARDDEQMAVRNKELAVEISEIDSDEIQN